MNMRYKSPTAFEQAVKAAARKSGRDVGKAIAAFWRDRLLCRVFSTPEPEFVLKGGQGMLAKIPDARETRDIDLLGTTTDLDQALDELKSLAARDLGDFVEFRFEGARPTDTSQDYRTGYTATFGVWLGGTAKRGTVSVDLVVDTVPPEDYDLIESVSSLHIEGLETHPYAVTKPASRVAEKVGATMQGYDGRPSSRVKDLADLVKTMLTEDVDADALARNLRSEAAVRKIGTISEFKVPDAWRTTMALNYRKIARESKLPERYEDVAAAEEAVAAWLQPVIDGKMVDATWAASKQTWEPKQG
jgi:hypothetical protein